MPARCSLQESDAFAASIGLGSIVKASALLKRRFSEYKFVVQPLFVGKGRLLLTVRTAQRPKSKFRAFIPNRTERLTMRCSESLSLGSLDDMNSVSRRRSRISLVVMIVGGFLAIAPVFGPLGKTLHYLADFIAERPQPMRAPDISFFVELLALIICPVGLLLFAMSLVLFIRSGRRTAPRA